MPEIPLPIPARAVKQGSTGTENHVLMVIDGLLRRVPSGDAQRVFTWTGGRTVLGNPTLEQGAAIGMTPEATKDLLDITPSDVNGLSTLLDNKANLIHTHAIADVTGLQAQLDAIAAGTALPTKHYATYPSLVADTTQPDATLALVYADPVIKTIQRQRNANLASVDCLTIHNYGAGQTVNVRDLGGDGLYNGPQVLTAVPLTTRIQFTNTGPNEAPVADTAGRLDRNGIYQSTAGTWAYVADAPFEILERRITALETITRDFGMAPGPLAGDIFYASGQGPGWGGWNRVWYLAERVIDVRLWDTPSQFQLLISPTTPPASASYTDLGGGNARIDVATSVFHNAATLLTNMRVGPWTAFVCEFDFLTGNETGATGCGVTFSLTPPATTGVAGAAPADSETYTFRPDVGSSGGIVYENDTNTSAGTSIVFTPSQTRPSNVIPVAGQKFGLVIACDGLGTGADVAIYYDKILVGTGTLTGLIPGMYVGPASRQLSAAQTMVSLKVCQANDGVPRRWHVDPSVGSLGNGTEKSPWVDFKDAVADEKSDPRQGHYEIFMRRGICLSAPSFAGKKVRHVSIRSVGGHGAYIYNAVQRFAGGAWFTRPEPGPNPNVWMFPLPAGCTPGATLVDLSATQPQGRTGKIVTPYAHQSRAPFDTLIATINSKPGWITYHTLGTYEGKYLFNPGPGIDPNTRNYYLSRGASGIEVLFESDDHWNVGKLLLEGIGVGFSFNGGVTVERGTLEAYGLDIFGCWACGIQLNYSDGRIYGGRVGGSGGDNISMSNGILGVQDRKNLVMIWDTLLEGNPTGLLDGALFGDCISNHSGTELHMDGVNMLCGAKDGLAAGDVATVKNCIIDDCVQYGVEGYGYLPGVPIVPPFLHSPRPIRVIGGRIQDCVCGVVSLADTADVTIEVDGGTIFRNNIQASLRTIQVSAVAKINAYNWKISGATPSAGHVDATSGGTILKTTPANVGDLV